jgi:serine/threonine protein kinase
MFEFLTGHTLFAVSGGFSKEDQESGDDDHLIQLHAMIKPLPESFMNLWPRGSKWYGPESTPLPIIRSLENLFAENKSPEIGDDEAAVVCELMRRMLEYDAAKRPSAVELLEHPWLAE